MNNVTKSIIKPVLTFIKYCTRFKVARLGVHYTTK